MLNKNNLKKNFPTPPFKGFKGVLLDIDNTIYNYDVCNEYAINILFSNITKIVPTTQEIVEEQYLKSRQTINKQLYGLASSHSRFLYIQLTLEKFLRKTAFLETLKMEKLYWDSFFQKMKIDKDANLFINQCKIHKIPICCITDLTVEIQFRKILKLNIEDKINFIVTSEESGAEKPNKKIFDLALEKLNLNYNEVIMCGDNISKDMKGAQALGIKTYLVKLS